MEYPINQPVEYLGPRAADIRACPKVTAPLEQRCNLVYCETDGVGLLMDVFRHPERSNGLGIVDVVSREWYGDRIRLNQHIGLGLTDVLCEAGFTVFAVSPGSVGHFTGPTLLKHVHAGVRYVRRQAAEFGVDAARLGLTGMSAGAHLAALAALHPQAAHPRRGHPDTHVRAVGLFFPPCDLVALGRERFVEGVPGGFSPKLLFEDGVDGRAPEEIAARLAELSPARAVAQHSGPLPPFLVFHGDSDPLVPLAQSEALVGAIGAAGGEARLGVKEGGGHPWPEMRPELAQLAAWFEEKLAE
jgi:acetyl esterase/lipase